MKRKLLLTAIACMLSAHALFSQTIINVATGGSGWKRVATVQGQNGRGVGRVSVFTQGGGNYGPAMTHIDWFQDWSTSAGVSVHSDSKSSPHWSAVRITGDEANIYIEVNFTKDIPSSSLRTMTDNGYGWRPATLYTGTLPNGGGTVRASATVGRMNIENQFMVSYNGNVGVGVANPQAKLAVNGNILAKEVKVQTDITVPDYVFGPGYRLPTLAEVEAYVKEHGHLPEIPSASDVERDGLDLAGMSLLLLKKVEELTLHLIEKEKEINRLAALGERVQALEAMFAASMDQPARPGDN